MEQRRLRPGDVVDDYCPRERRLTDHAIVALIDDTIRQVRCVSCEAEHEYKEARVLGGRFGGRLRHLGHRLGRGRWRHELR